VRRDEVQDESLEYFHRLLWALQTQCLHVRSSSTQPAVKVARGLSPVDLTAEGCVRLEIDKLSTLQLLDESHGMKGRQIFYRL